jgi:hypothetical protein
MENNGKTSELLSWKVHLSKKNRTKGIAVIVLILICSYFIYFTMEDFFFTLISTFVLIIMVLPYYLPSTYTLTDSEITKKMLFSKQRRMWSEFNRYDIDKNVIKLYTMKKASRLDNYRSFLLICNKNKDEVLAWVKKKVPEPRNGDNNQA